MGLLDDLCRFCSQQLDCGQSKNIFEVENRNLLKTALLCIPLPMSADDHYPKHACIHCVFKINVVTEFQNLGLSAFKTFNEILSNEGSKTSGPDEKLEIKAEELSDVEFIEEEEQKMQVPPLISDNIFQNENCNSDDHNSSKKRTNSMEMPYPCGECGKSFTVKGRLIRHLRQHTGEKPHQCVNCNKCFSHREHLNAHIRIHTREGLYQCAVCSRTFVQKANLIRHIRVHTGEKPYKCKICKKAFAQKGDLTRHVRIHTLERYKCKECDKTFTQISSLTRHSYVHTGEIPYQCVECKKSFTRKSALLNHGRHHAVENFEKAKEKPQGF